MNRIIIAIVLACITVGCVPHVQQTVPPRDAVQPRDAVPPTHDVFVGQGPSLTSGTPTPSSNTGIVSVGAAPALAPTAAPQATACAPLPPREDSFDKAGDVFAASSRFVYDSASGTWHWIKNEKTEHQDQIDAAEHKVGEMMGSAADAAKKRARKSLHEIQAEYNKLTNK